MPFPVVSVACRVAVLILIGLQWVGAHSILGFAVMAGVSHQLNVLKIGHELADRGHEFSMLLSSQDAIGIDTITKHAFPGLKMVTFSGPAGVGTEEWASSLSRDPQTVSS